MLASSSPRRAALLKQIGLNFRVIVCDLEEHTPPGLQPFEVVERLAARKAMFVADSLAEGIVVGADTVVVWRGQLLGKPSCAEDAVEMLKRLQGNVHEVLTGVALVDAGSGKAEVGHEQSRVMFRPLDEEEIRRYVATGEPLDKAGSYGAQGIGAVFVERIEGSYTNIVGLPLAKLSLMLKNFGCSVL
ncbi:Maf family protein [Pelotomaculum terephthalicicum]|uniref:Maf family protein n=1 Tax=Pelotomaculum terephthalicicum TaxID=206393 RepID=UPI0028A1CCA5|nr:Maf family protein [Pelotomaculum terephthalicicum]